MKRVQIESPFAGDQTVNLQYAHDCLRDSLSRGEAPFASHLLYPQVLNDASREERLKGIVAGFQWMEVCDLVAVYTDLGVSPGMEYGIKRARDLGKPIEYRNLRDEV